MELPELQLWSPPTHFPDEVMGLPILPDVLVGESCASPCEWCRTQLPRLPAAHGAAVKPSVLVHRLVQEGRADLPSLRQAAEMEQTEETPGKVKVQSWQRTEVRFKS